MPSGTQAPICPCELGSQIAHQQFTLPEQVAAGKQIHVNLVHDLKGQRHTAMQYRQTLTVNSGDSWRVLACTHAQHTRYCILRITQRKHSSNQYRSGHTECGPARLVV